MVLKGNEMFGPCLAKSGAEASETIPGLVCFVGPQPGFPAL